MKTPLQQIIERFERGRDMHEKQMNKKGLSSTEKNRASYLYHHSDAIVSIATGLLEEEENNIKNSWINGFNYDGSDIDNSNEESHAKKYFNSEFESE